jgi:hypothetical protein
LSIRSLKAPLRFRASSTVRRIGCRVPRRAFDQVSLYVGVQTDRQPQSSVWPKELAELQNSPFVGLRAEFNPIRACSSAIGSSVWAISTQRSVASVARRNHRSSAASMRSETRFSLSAGVAASKSTHLLATLVLRSGIPCRSRQFYNDM